MVAGRVATIATCTVATMLIVPIEFTAEPSPGDRQLAPQSPVPTAESSTLHVTTGRRRDGAPIWPGVHLSDPAAKQIALQALDLASTLLGEHTCANVLNDFTDREGLALSQRLDTLGFDAQTYLRSVRFLEETRRKSCGIGVIARTIPGSRVVWVCSTDLRGIWAQDRAYTVAVFIHEMLHTLGLGENPPSPKLITRQVLARCELR